MKIALTNVAVTRKHITEGKCGSPSKCAVALALAEHAPAGTTVFVNGRTARYASRRTSVRMVVDLPEKVRTFIDRFDGVEYGQRAPRPIRFMTAVPTLGLSF